MIAQGYPGGGDLTALKALTAAGATVVHPPPGVPTGPWEGYKAPSAVTATIGDVTITVEGTSPQYLPKSDGSKDWVLVQTSPVETVKQNFEADVAAAKKKAEDALKLTASGRKVKLGEGHEAISIKEVQKLIPMDMANVPGIANAANTEAKMNLQGKIFLAIAATKMPAFMKSAKEARNKAFKDGTGADPVVVPKGGGEDHNPDGSGGPGDFIKIAEAADFAYLSDQGKTCGALDDCMICGLLACFLEFHVYGGVAASTDGKLEEDKTDLLQSWGHFKSKQVGFAAFVTTKKLLDVGATPRLAAVGSKKVGMEGIGEAGTAWNAFIAPYDAKLNQAQTKPTTFCALVTVIETRCKVHHAGIKAVCT